MTLRQKISDIPLYLQILIGMITGIIIGLIALQVDGGDTFHPPLDTALGTNLHPPSPTDRHSPGLYIL